jgi:hypothetical protein
MMWLYDRAVVGIVILPAGLDIRRISDPSGSVSGTNLYPRVLPVPDL